MPTQDSCLMKHHFLTLLLALAATFGSAPVSAERADRSKPMNVEADALRYDDLRQTSIFTGRVVATKGTIVVRGARIEVKQDPEGFHQAIVTAAPGQLAFWRQKRDNVDEYIEGEGETIEYDGRADRVKFVGRAEMRRFQGATLADETSGNLITYDNTTDVFTVDGGAAAGGAAAANPGGRVRAVLAPRGAATAPAAPAGAPAAPLRSSPSVSGERR
jgi:lipopolysaccharide export system protein LptA